MAEAEDDIEVNVTLPPTMQRVYDLEGNEHIMTHLNVHDMVTHMKWTRVKPVIKIVEVPAGSVVKKKAGKATVASPAVDTATDAPKNVDEMTREELLAEAAVYKIPDADVFSDEDLRNAITVERE